ncbi:probable methyltransferase PMT10 [Durio zibethinus]|uniref:Methyltransferase n=1 Tax=Durio zibethinus TaxID=66656 RepID=A0A6P6ATH2_DURZI|nr:probable methyltransferase PMT10 [Durio zibethinus]
MDMRAELGGCEPFDTCPRAYDLLHAACLFFVEKKRCNMSTIMLEMDRMLRPCGHVNIWDSVSVMGELQETATAMGWVPALHETGEGPRASWKILISDVMCVYQFV